MKVLSVFLLVFCLSSMTACAQQKKVEPLSSLPEVVTDPSNYNPLEAEEARVIIQKGTEYSFSGAFHDFKGKGTYICKQCNLPLFQSEDKFDSGTGWPSFDDAIAGNVEELTDADGRRTEIVCSNCKGHLGHVFKGEGFTDKQTRHCANSVSLSFVEEKAQKNKQ
jgi:methionine-R-sulfoxide reductase